MYAVVEAMQKLAEELGVIIKTDAVIDEIIVKDGIAEGLIVNGTKIEADIIVSGADYHHTETLLPQKYRVYTEEYWNKKTFAPSSLLFYVGFDKK